MVRQRQPLRDRTTATPMRMRSIHGDDENDSFIVRKQPRSKSARGNKQKKKAPGIENELLTPSVQQQQQQQHRKKQTPARSKSERSKSRVKVLLGGMFGKRSSSRYLQLETNHYADLKEGHHCHQELPQQQHRRRSQPQQLLYKREQHKSVGKDAVHDGSLTSVLTPSEIEPSERVPSPSLFLNESERHVVDVRLFDSPKSVRNSKEGEDLERRETTTTVVVAEGGEFLEELQEKQKRRAATYLQALFRGYKQRYEFRMMILHKKLEQIQANKERQLRKISQRQRTRLRQAKSVFDFQNPREKTSRQLHRMARIIPYLFREAQTKMTENAQLASTGQHVRDLETFHLHLQTLAHSYLETLEDLPGIWEALKSQWMAPKKPRPRRSFGDDGKIIKQPRVLIQFINTHDDDLPVVEEYNTAPPTPQLSPMARQASDVSNEHSNLFVNYFIQACAAEIYSTEDDIDEAAKQVHDKVGKYVWN